MTSTTAHSESNPSEGSASSKPAAGNNNAIGIKETLTSLIIAFMLAFLFRGFVIEGFQIPTGSMAPTLMGKHVRFESPYNGYDWSVGPWTYGDARQINPTRQQMDMNVNDPMSGLGLTDTNRRLAAGDRVFVLKYLPFLQSPNRWDVVVFKNPGTHENYIKRLVGLPGEQVALVDGDVFVRPFVEGQTERSGWDSWTGDDWSIARKSERVQRAMLQDVFDSRFVPSEPTPEFRSPFSGSTAGWEGVGDQSVYRFTGAGSTVLSWNGKRDITDANPYNQTTKYYKLFAKSDEPRAAIRRFPVSDIAISINIEADSSPIRISPILEARGMEFRAVVDSGVGQATLEMRDQKRIDDSWTSVDSASFAAFKEGEIHSVEFWHMDQSLWLFIDGQLVCGGQDNGGYKLSPANRAVAAMGKSWGELEDDNSAGDGLNKTGVFDRSQIYKKPSFRWAFSGGSFTIHNTSVKRDIAYQINARSPTRGGHPNNFSTLTSEEYFMCGDNSERSLDSRLWTPGSIDPWVNEEINDRVGVVHQDLVVGRAFLVYFPAPLDNGPILAPDFGRMRWIW